MPASPDGADKQQGFEAAEHKTPGRPWKPGESGNPSGRPPKGEAYSDILRELMELSVAELRAMARNIGRLPAKRATALRQILDGLMAGGYQRLSVAARVRVYTFNRLDGNPHASVETNDPRADRMETYIETMASYMDEAIEAMEAVDQNHV